MSNLLNLEYHIQNSLKFNFNLNSSICLSYDTKLDSNHISFLLCSNKHINKRMIAYSLDLCDLIKEYKIDYASCKDIGDIYSYPIMNDQMITLPKDLIKFYYFKINLCFI